MTDKQPPPDLEKRMELLMKVLLKQMTATEAAAQLNVSRKTFYEWLERASENLLQSQLPKAPGRPKRKVDEEKEALKKQVKDLEYEKEILEVSLEIMKIWEDVDPVERAKVFNGNEERKPLKKKRLKKRKKKPPI